MRRGRRDLVRLRNRGDELRDLIAEPRPDLVERHAGVVDDVVQAGGAHDVPVGAEAGEDLRDLDRVQDVREVGALAPHAAMRRLRQPQRRAVLAGDDPDQIDLLRHRVTVAATPEAERGHCAVLRTSGRAGYRRPGRRSSPGG
jgi:hypothetical protein